MHAAEIQNRDYLNYAAGPYTREFGELLTHHWLILSLAGDICI
jgi:hypothetical protein